MKVTLRAKLCVFFLICICIFIFSSCETVPSGHASASPAPSIASVTKPPIATPDITAPIVAPTITAVVTPEIQNKSIDFKNKIIISEICAKNNAGLRSASGGFYDWIEISNLSSETLPLIDLYITNDESVPQKFKIPEISLAPGKCLLLFASASENPQSGEIHLPFKLSTEGETITLYTKDSTFVDRVEYENLAPDSVLYKNRSGDMMRETFYATPGYPNTDAGYHDFCKSRPARGPLMINELAVTNDQTLIQSDGECYDWLEIKNISSREILLSDYYITDKIDRMKYVFPDEVLGPGDIFIVICSGTQKTDPSGYFHAGFSLNAESESLYLCKIQNQEIFDWVQVKKVPYGASYGRKDTDSGFFYFATPSPGRENSGGIRKVCEEALSTLREGVYDKDVLSVGFEASGTIYYTTDGSEPDRNAQKYTAPLILSKSTVIRTIVYEDGKLPSRIATYSYFMNLDTTLPVLSLVTESDNLWSEETGIYVKGKYENYYQDWERDAALSYFDSGNGFNMNCALKMNGSGSRESDEKKSFKVNFKGKYGKSELEYDLFGNGVTAFDSLVLRAGEDYRYSIFRNELFTTFARRHFPSLIAQCGKYCSLYINGEYFGIYYLQERLNEKFYAEHCNVSEDSVTVSEYKPEEGSDLYQIMQFAKDHDMTNSENYQYIQSKIDIESMTDWFILQAYSGNTDAIQNIRYMKTNVDGGKWKWAFYDLDWAFYFHKNSFEDLIDADLCETNQMIKPLLLNSEYRNYFLERLAYHIKNTFKNENVLEIADEYYMLLKPEIEKERAFWGGSQAGWEQSVMELRAYLTEYDRCGELIESVTAVLNLTDSEVKRYFGS